ncbi:MAG: hypothetical protein RI953_2290 [Pseudomonadota bacterium]|jgi:hypothetical protein
MPANHTLHLGLTKVQMEWIERTAEEKGRSKSKVVQDIVDASMKSETLSQKLDLVLEKNADFEKMMSSLVSINTHQLEVVLAYVKEVFRESSANLYRLNAMIDEFPEPEKTRTEVNDFVRKQEAILRSRTLKINEGH